MTGAHIWKYAVPRKLIKLRVFDINAMMQVAKDSNGQV